MLKAWNAPVAGVGLGNRFRSAVMSSTLEGEDFIRWIEISRKKMGQGT
jgi:hypothetical protein